MRRSTARLALLALLLVPAAPLRSQPEEPGPGAAAPIDPDTLVVAAPEPPDPRDPAEDINKLLRAEFSILESSRDLEMNIARRTGELDHLRHQEEVVERDLGAMAARFDELTAQVDAARELVRRRLRAMIQLSRTEPYQVLFAAETWETFLRRKRAIEALVKVDRRRISSYREQLDAWRSAKGDLERRRTNLVRTREEIGHTLEQLGWDREEKQALLEAVRERRAFSVKVDQEWETVDEELREKVESLGEEERTRLWIEENKGKLLKPVWKGEVVGRFGLRTHPKLKTRTVHRGLDIEAPEGWADDREVPVRSVYWGYVAFVGWMRGLGQTVIVDHTRGYMSLYAHLAAVDVKVGDKVKTGGRIGAMGDTGSLHGRRLYLELRKDGQAIDPKPWIR